MVVTQHVKNISTLSDAQNAQLECAIKVDDRDDEEEGTAPTAEAAVATRDKIGAAQYGGGGRKKSKKPWARQAHRTRSASKREQSAARQKERDASDEVVSVAYGIDRLNYGESMRSTKCAECQTAIKK